MSSERTVAELLRQTELFGQLGQTDQVLIAREMHQASFQAGQTIFSRGDRGEDIYLVVEGRVRLSVMKADGRTVSFRHACQGSIFGEIAALDRGARTADATALTRVVAKTLSMRSLDRLTRTNPRVARGVIEYLCKRLRDTSEQVESIALHPLETRLARLLLSVSKASPGEQSHLGLILNFGISQSEVALLVGGSRQKVNAALARLEAAGAIKRQRGNLACNVSQLARIAELEGE